MFEGVKNYMTIEAPEKATETTTSETETKTTDTVETVETTEEKKETPPVETAEAPKETTEKAEDVKTDEVVETKEEVAERLEISDNDVLEYLKANRGFEGENIDVLFQPKEEIDPFEKYSDKVKEFLKYIDDTNRDFDDWMALQKDYTKLTPIDLAREKAIRESDGELTLEDVDSYLEKRLGIDLSDVAEMDKFDLIDLKKYGKDYLQSKIAEQEKYRTPLEQKKAEVQKFKLDDGREVTREEYQQILDNNKKKYIQTLKKSSDNIKGLGFEIPFNVNGETKTINVGYDYSTEDKHKMVSDASDIDNFFVKNFQNKDGSIKAQELQEALWRMNPDNFKKVVMDAAQKMSAEVIELNMAKESNFKFPTDTMPKKNGKTKTVPVTSMISPTFNKYL